MVLAWRNFGPLVGSCTTAHYIRWMSIHRAAAPRQSLFGALVALGLVLGFTPEAAHAQQRPIVTQQRSTIPQRPTILPRRPTLQQRLQADTISRSQRVPYAVVREWQKRQDAQARHQYNLDQDRQNRMRSRPNLEVQEMQRNCQTPAFGNKYMPRPCR